MNPPTRSFEETSLTRLARPPPGFAASLKSSSRVHYRPPPILLIEGERKPASSSPGASTFSAASMARPIRTPRPNSPIEPLDSPAFMKGDLNFNTFRSRAARAIAEWGPSPTGTQFCKSDLLTPRRNPRLVKPVVAEPTPTSTTASEPICSVSNTLQLPSQNLRHSQSHGHFTSPPGTPFTPLTPGPCSSPQHRASSRPQHRPSLKTQKLRHRPCPLQLHPQPSCERLVDETGDETELRNVRFADGSPMRGSTWHLTQYPQRLASPPISAANLTLADLVELEAIKQSLGTWCGEIMGSPMRVSFIHSTLSSDSDGPATLISSPTSSDVDWQARWPASPPWSDCDSEIFEGMH